MEAIHLSTLDILVMVVYFVGLLCLGLYYRKFARKGLDNYFLGGRNMSGFMNGVSYAATCLNADVAPAYCGMTVITGVFVYWWYISRFSLALMIGGILFAVFWRRLNIFTSPEYYEIRFTGNCAKAMRTWVAVRSAFIAVVAWSAAGLIGVYKVANTLFLWEKWEVIMLIVPVIIIYVLLSGFKGVVVSDFIQSMIIIVAGVVLLVAVMIDFDGPKGLYDALFATFGSEAVSWSPPRSHEMLGLLGVVTWMIGSSVGYGGDVAPMGGAMEGQRILSCRTPREAAKMYIWTIVILFIMLTLIVLPALGAMVKWPGLHDGTINKELAYGLLLREYLPTGLLGLATISMMSSIMSTISSNMNFGSQVFLNDIYRRFICRHKSDGHYMRVGKVVMVVIVVLAIVVALYAENVIDISVFMLGLAANELTANWAQWWWWRFNGKARLAASFGGPAIFLINKLIIFEYFIIVPDPTYVIILTSITLTCVLWISVTLLTRPEPEEVLVEFYRRVKPMGWWQPIARKAGIKHVGITPILKGLSLALTGTVMIASGTIAFANIFIYNITVTIIALLVAIVSGLFFLKYYRRYMKELAVDEE